MSGSKREELERMTMKQLKEYAKQIGCCLGYDGSRKDTAVTAILAFLTYNKMDGRKS